MSNKQVNRREIITKITSLLHEQSTQIILFHTVIAEELGLNVTDLKALDLLIKSGKMSAGQLADRTGLTTGAITGVIDRLERADFALRVPDPSDRRRIFVEPAPDAYEKMYPVFAPMRKHTKAFLEKYKDAELEVIVDFMLEFIGLVEKIRTVFGK